MAKSAAEEVGTDVAVHRSGGVPVEMGFSPDELDGLDGLGYSEKAEDTLVPILAILQDNSGEVKKGHSKRMDGAEAGYVILRALKKVIEATKPEPILIQPCGFSHNWVQWRGEPGEGQVITQYPFDDRPVEAIEKPDPQNDDRTIVVMPNGDRLVDTRYHFCRALIDDVWMPVVIPMGGTNHSVSKQWTGQMKAVRINNRPVPAWFRLYGLSTAFQQRGQQSWYTYNIEDRGWVEDPEQRAEGRKVFESVSSGVIAPDTASEAGESAAVHDEDSPV